MCHASLFLLAFRASFEKNYHSSLSTLFHINLEPSHRKQGLHRDCHHNWFKVFWYFQGIYKEASGIKWVNCCPFLDVQFAFIKLYGLDYLTCCLVINVKYLSILFCVSSKIILVELSYWVIENTLFSRICN